MTVKKAAVLLYQLAMPLHLRASFGGLLNNAIESHALGVRASLRAEQGSLFRRLGYSFTRSFEKEAA